jgi:hypothetical protein
MAIRIPAEIRDALREYARKTGALGGKAAAENMTAAERKARAEKASKAAKKKRDQQRTASTAAGTRTRVKA